MARWLWIVPLIAVAGYGWHRTAESRARGPDEIVVVNRSGHDVEHLHLAAAGRRAAVRSLASGATARLPLRCDRDGTFELRWRAADAGRELAWSGGRMARGPLPMRYRLELIPGDGVVWRSERRPAPRAR